MLGKETVLKRLRDDVISGISDDIIAVANEGITLGIPALEMIEEGLREGMTVVSEKYNKKEYFIPHLLLAADAMKAALDVLKPLLKVEGVKTPDKIIIGTVKGDIHDIGKDIVATMFITAGYEVFDLGIDVEPKKFAEKAIEVDADVVGSSAFMTTTMGYQKEIERELERAGVRDKLTTIIGGPPTSPSYAKHIGADDWAENALEAVEKVKELLKKRKGG